MNRAEARLNRLARGLRREMLTKHQSLILQEPPGAAPCRRILKPNEAELVLDFLQKGWRPLAFKHGKLREYVEPRNG